jgi:hypothetical protein
MKDCTPALCRIARRAGQAVPDWLARHEKSKASKTWKVEHVDNMALGNLTGSKASSA